MKFLEALLSGTNNGLMWGLLALGVFISYRVLDFADLSCEGSIVTGGAVALVLINAGCPAVIATVLAMIVGAGAGLITGFLHTKLKVPPILAGILTMTALYSINFLIMGNNPTVELSSGRSGLFGGEDGLWGIAPERLKFYRLALGAFLGALFIGGLYLFFGTEIGARIRATGDNQKMCRAQGINTDTTKVIGLMISNAMIALSGAVLAQSGKSMDLKYGSGAIVIGLASVIIGEAIFFKAHSFWAKLLATLVGCIAYQLVSSFMIFIPGFKSEYLNLITAVIIALALAMPTIKTWIAKYVAKRKRQQALLVSAAQEPDAPLIASSEATPNAATHEEVI